MSREDVVTDRSGLVLAAPGGVHTARRRFLAALALAGVGVVAACGASGSPQSSNDTSAATAVARVSTGMNSLAGAAQSTSASVVKMTAQNTLDPPTVTIPAGGAVTWENDATTPQSATFDPAKAANKGDVQLPQGAQPFDSGAIAPGQIWTHRFAAPGTYQYVAGGDGAVGTKGIVVVT
jgi:plastocyanin